MSDEHSNQPLSEPEMIDVAAYLAWTDQVNRSIEEFNDIIAGLDRRLHAVEGQNWALTRVSYALIKLGIAPQDSAKEHIQKIVAILKNDPRNGGDAQKTYLDSAQVLLEELLAGEPPSPPRFSVIEGGKTDPQK